MQADRRALNITLNSIGTELTRDDRRKLYSNFGLLYPHGQVLVKRNCPAQHEYTACQPDAAEWWAVAVCLHLLIVCSARGPQAELALALARAMAGIAILDWEGVGDADGKPLPVSPEAAAALMDVWPIF